MLRLAAIAKLQGGTPVQGPWDDFLKTYLLMYADLVFV